ncbi:MAG TPA: SAF domain-containing protein [Acidimicrobiia bacterium]|nr:SAF domain-containing protein [Acidimicrobiia bacterium]
MYWLPRPPYLRWAGAALLLVGALAWDLRGPAIELRPFAARPLAAGEAVDASAVEWREVPAGLLPTPDLDGAAAAVDLAAGDPLVDAVLSRAVAVPAGWWEVPVAVGTHAAAGDSVMLVITDPPATVEGLVVSPQQGDAYSLDFRPAVVAVPAEAGALVAAAAAAGSLVAAIAP